MNQENDSETEIVVESSFEAASRASCERMWALTPDERLDIHERLMRFIYPDGLGDKIEPVFEVIHL
jgi:hypothetical protein